MWQIEVIYVLDPGEYVLYVVVKSNVTVMRPSITTVVHLHMYGHSYFN